MKQHASRYSEITTFCVITLCVRKVITICVERLLHSALKILLHFASMLLHFALVLHFAAILITFCVNTTFCCDYYISRRNICPWAHFRNFTVCLPSISISIFKFFHAFLLYLLVFAVLFISCFEQLFLYFNFVGVPTV